MGTNFGWRVRGFGGFVYPDDGMSILDLGSGMEFWVKGDDLHAV